MKMKIVLASHNQHKCFEIVGILEDMNIKLLTLNEFPEIGEIEDVTDHVAGTNPYYR